MVWKPLDINEVCPADTHLTACSHFAYVYLNVLVQLFGTSPEETTKQHNHDHNDMSDQKVISYLDEYPRSDNHRKRSFDNDQWKNIDEVYDFIVVGAGSAGCVVANRLTEVTKWRVLLLEAGPEEPDITQVPALSTALLGSNVDWQYRTQPDGKTCLAQYGSTCSWPRGKMMGGSSSINSLAYVRGNKLDFDTWADMGNNGWSFSEVLHYFKKSEDNLNLENKDKFHHGVDGPQSISRYPYVDEPSLMLTEAFAETGLPLTDFNGKNQLGTMQAQAFSKNGERVSANTAFIRPIRYKRSNLTVKPKSEVIKILINPKTKEAFGVKYIKNGKLYKAIANKEVIVSAGAINSPKLLMLSGIGPKNQLNNLHIDVIEDLPVGENLHDHITFNGAIVALPNRTATTVSEKSVIEELYKYKNSNDKIGPLSGNGPVNSIAFIKTDQSLSAPDIQFQVNSANLNEYLSEPTLYEQLTIFPTSFYDAVVPRTMLLTPKSRGVLLLNTTDPVFGPPLLYPNYFQEEEDLKVLLKGVKFLLTLGSTNAFKSRGAYFEQKPLEACYNYEWGTEAYYKCLALSYTSTTFHPVGTCKMGPKWDKTAVVDPKLRVSGIERLRVIDASIMPVITRGNTNAPSLMIGEKGADLIKEDWLH